MYTFGECKAMSYVSEALRLQTELNNHAGIVEGLVGIGSVLLAIGQANRALHLFGFSEPLRENAGVVL